MDSHLSSSRKYNNKTKLIKFIEKLISIDNYIAEINDELIYNEKHLNAFFIKYQYQYQFQSQKQTTTKYFGHTYFENVFDILKLNNSTYEINPQHQGILDKNELGFTTIVSRRLTKMIPKLSIFSTKKQSVFDQFSFKSLRQIKISLIQLLKINIIHKFSKKLFFLKILFLQ